MQPAFARNIKALREGMGLTQEELANEIQVERNTVVRWENGKVAKPRQPEIINKLKNYFDVSDSDLFGYNDGFYAKKYGLAEAPAGATHVTPVGARMIPIRKLGAVHAGYTDEQWTFDGEAMLYESLAAKHPNCYALTVNGTCMNLNFTDRDTIFVDPDMEPKDGSIAVISIENGEAMVRRVRFGNNSIMLVAETTDTDQWQDIIIQGGNREVSLIGTVFWWQSSSEGE